METCVALSGADVYCTGWAGWQGGRWELSPQLCGGRGRVAPGSGGAAYIQCGRLQRAGLRPRAPTLTPPPSLGARVHTGTRFHALCAPSPAGQGSPALPHW